MSTIVLRGVKGTPLTNAEVDANFNNLNTDKLEAATVATLTNKTINLANNTLQATSAQLAAAVSDETGSGALVFANSPTLVTPNLGTPSAATLTNATGLPVSTGISGLGTGVATFLATPSSANLAAAVSDETGSGALVFGTSPSIAAPTITGALTLSGGTANGVAYLNGSKVLTTGSALTFDGAILGVNGVSVGRGAGSVSTNTAVGASALAANTTGYENVAVGSGALNANTNGYNNVSVGRNSLFVNTSGAINTALGDVALRFNTTGNFNTAVGGNALYANTTASNNTAVGYQAMYLTQTGGFHAAVGVQSLYSITQNIRGSVALGYQAGYATTTGSVTALGVQSLSTNTTGNYNVAVGNTTIFANTTGSNNVAVGDEALRSNTTASNNTAVGFQAGYANTTGADNTFLGQLAGYGVTTGSRNTLVGFYTGSQMTTGTFNNFIGTQAGQAVTTGSKNTILGAYSGNQGGLDIRTASNYIVLSDGDGNPRGYHNATDWVLSPSYRTYLTRGNNGGNDGSTGSSGNFFKIGTWHVSGQGARATLRIAGATGFSNGVTTAGETVIFLVYENSNDVEGFYYSLVGGSSTSVNAVAVKNTGGAVEVWVKTGAFASTAVFPDCVFSRWEGANSDTGSTSTPSGATLLDSYFRYLDSGASNSAITLNRNGIGIGDAVPSSGTGITFPATQNASSNANTLDDYEEGTWSPVLTDGTNTTSLGTGIYVKIGRMVYCSYDSFGNSISGWSGNMGITGLPFTANASYSQATYMFPTGANDTPVLNYVQSNSSTIALYKAASGSQSVAQLQPSDFATSTISMRHSFSYMTSA